MKDIYIIERKYCQPKYAINESGKASANVPPENLMDDTPDIIKFLTKKYPKRKINIIANVSKKSFKKLKPSLETKLKKATISRLPQ